MIQQAGHGQPCCILTHVTAVSTWLQLILEMFQHAQLQEVKIMQLSVTVLHSVTDMSKEYAPLVEIYWQGKVKYLGGKMYQCHFVHHKFYVDWPGINPGSLLWEASDCAMAWPIMKWLWHILRNWGQQLHATVQCKSVKVHQMTASGNKLVKSHWI